MKHRGGPLALRMSELLRRPCQNKLYAAAPKTGGVRPRPITNLLLFNTYLADKESGC